ncbi:MAG: YfhO family protein, partial [Lachnospiraceae bacterium]|nr:YfhO family protein [Lachnospiraceae bacterium]
EETGLRQGISLFFSLGNAMSGFLMAYNWNIMWLDAVILLPLILWGLERLVKEGKPFLYCLTLAVSIWSNFYLSMMICMFLVLYFGYLLLTGQSDMQARNGGWRRAVREFVVFSLLAGGIAAVLLVPEICALAATDFGAMDAADPSGQYFAVLDVFARHCMDIRPMHLDNHWPNVYCGVCAFLLVPLYAVNDRIPMRRRFGLLALIGFFLFSFETPALDLVWHGMNYPDGMPARQSFIYILLVIVLCHEGVVHMDFADSGQKWRVSGAYLADIGLLFFVWRCAKESGIEAADVILTGVFVTIYAVLMMLAYLRQNMQERRLLLFVAVIVMLLETQINAVETNVISSKWGEHMDPTAARTLYVQATTQEQGIVRAEIFDREMFNEGIRAQYPSASLFSSTQNSVVRAFYERLGMRYNKVFYGFEGNTPFSAALLNVQYMFGANGGYENTLYTVAEQKGDVWLYKANGSLPFGYVAPVGYDLEGDAEGLVLQNQLVHALDIEEELFALCETAIDGDAVTFEAAQEGLYYAVLTTDGIEKVSLRGVNVSGMGWNTQYLHQNSVIYLGQMAAGQQGRIANADTGEEARQMSALVYRLNEDVLAQALSKLSEQHLENVTYDSTHINGELNLAQAGRLILSVPYEKGWQVRVNGTRVEPETFGGAFFALDLEPGAYVLEMRYVPYGFYAGAGISLLSVVLLVVLWIARKGVKKQ